MAPAPELDEQLRPKWLFGRTVHESCNRAAFYEQGDFATEYGSDHRCLVKLGCKGPVVKCNVPVRGWQSGIGGCPNVGGICMACTMPGFPDKFMPFMDEAPRAGRRTIIAGSRYGPIVRYFRRRNVDQEDDVEPAWRRQGRRSPPATRSAGNTGYEHQKNNERKRVRDGDSDSATERKRSSSRRCRGIRSRGSSGSLGIHTEIDFTNQQVLKCYSTSMVFRGFDIFMKGIDPRDAHFITSRICGICGDNHCTCSCLNQNMAYGVKPPKLGDYAFNLAESADFMFDHAIFNDCMANVDFCEQIVKETNPTVLETAENTPSPHADIHGYKTIADIMRALNPFTGSFYLETLQVARYTREMYCLFGGRHTHPSTIMPGGCSADITHQTCTDYYVRLMRYIEYVKRTVPMHDDLYDFFLSSCRATTWSATATPTSSAGAASTTRLRRLQLHGHDRVGSPSLHHTGPGLQGRAGPTDLVEINLAMRILLGSSYFDDWSGEETFVSKDPLGNPVDKRHPWNKTTLPKPQKRDFADKYSWVASPRMYDERNDTYVACDTGGGPFARQWVRPRPASSTSAT